MNSLSTPWLVGIGAVVVALSGFAAETAFPFAAGLVPLAVLIVLAVVTLEAQSRRLHEAQRLVYRPVHVRRQSVQHRVRSMD